MKERLVDQLYEKINNEYKQYESELLKKSQKEILNNVYEIAVKKEFPDMFYGTNNYNTNEIKALLKLENTLNYLYDEWIKTDGGLHNLLEDSLEISITDLATDYVNNIKELIDNSEQKELIRIISVSLDEFDNYNFCDNFKSKYGIEKIESIEDVDIYRIINTKSGRKDLYNLFEDLKNDEHLEYLNSVSVVNSEAVDNVDRIYSELKSLIQKEKQQEMER